MMSIYAYLIYLSCFFQLSSLHCFLCFLFSPDQARNSYLLEPVLLLLHQARPHYLWHTYRNIYKNKMQFVSTSSHIHCLTGGKLLTVQKQSYIMTWQKSNQIYLLQGNSYSLAHLATRGTYSFHIITKSTTTDQNQSHWNAQPHKSDIASWAQHIRILSKSQCISWMC